MGSPSPIGLVAALLGALAAPARAADPATVDLCATASFVADPGGALGLADVAGLPPERLRPLGGCPLNMGISAAPLWLRIPLPERRGTWTLVFRAPLAEELDLYLPEGEGHRLVTGGLARAATPGGFAFHAWGHEADLPPGGGVAWLRVRTRAPLVVDLEAHRPGEIEAVERLRFLFYGLDLAAFLFFTVLNAVRWIRRRDYVGLFTARVTAAFGAFELVFFGFVPWLIPMPARLTIALVYATACGSLIFGLQGARRFLRLERHEPTVDRVFAWGAWAAAAGGTLAIAFPSSVAWASPALCGLASLACAGGAAAASRRGDGVTRGFTITLAVVMAAVALFSASWLGLVPASRLASAAMRLSFWIGIAILTASLRVRRDQVLRQRRAGLEQEVADTAGELERTAREREQLAEQLRQSQKLEAIGRLAGGVAHDFNNLLTVVTGNLAAIRDELPEGSEGRALAAEIDDAVERATALTRRLLAFGRRQPMAPRPIDLASHADGMRRVLARLLGESVTLTLDLRASPAVVLADPAQLEQVLLNLVSNARDALPRGGTVRLATAWATGPDGKRRVALSVEDDGPGIPPEIRGKIFEPFFTTKAEGKGTGLGLATTYGIVRQHGGTIEVDSTPGRGACFRVVLPEADEGAAVAATPERPAAERRGGGTILLVEDERLVRDVAARVLERQGYRVLAAGSGARALELLRRHAVDLLLTDVVMPGTDGCDLARLARAERPGLRVLFVSGYSDDELARRGLGDGEAAVLHKPFTPEELGERVAEAMAMRAARRSPAA